MTKNQLCYQSEELAKQFMLFGSRARDAYRNHIRGLVRFPVVLETVRELHSLDSESYIETVIGSLETSARPSGIALIEKIGTLTEVFHSGPFYTAIVRLTEGDDIHDVGVLIQDRSHANGAWMPEHHIRAHEYALRYQMLGLPVVCLVDTPGAEANEAANRGNQAHSISRLIATMGSLEVPTVGIIYGLGYSGGAIPFTACNINLGLRDSAFSTIQPKGLSSIARRLNLSWEKCAQIVGVSAFELFEQGLIDGVIDYAPTDPDTRAQNVRLAILSSLAYLEQLNVATISRGNDLQKYYLSLFSSHGQPNEATMQFRATLAQKADPQHHTLPSSQFPSLYGVGFRHLRYLSARRRLHSIPKNQLGAIREDVLLPKKDATSADSPTAPFFQWAQNSGKIIYQSTAFVKSWKRYKEARETRNSAAGRLSTLLFGSPQKRYEKEQKIFPKVYTSELYQQWKNQGAALMLVLSQSMRNPTALKRIVSVDQVADPFGFADSLIKGMPPLDEICSHWSPKTVASIKRLALNSSKNTLSSQDRNQLARLITMECNQLIASGYDAKSLLESLSPWFERSATDEHSTSDAAAGAASLYDILQIDSLHETLYKESINILIFDYFYDYLISQLAVIAEGGLHKNALAEDTLERFFEKGVAAALETYGEAITDAPVATDNFRAYCAGLSHKEGRKFLASLQEWKRASHPRISETLFVIITDILGRIIPSWIEGKERKKSYKGSFKPLSIGKIKDFWNRLTIAYQDLLIQKLLSQVKREHPISAADIIKRYFVDFKEIMSDQVSSDPCSFPGFRLSISKAIEKNNTPCGLVVGIGIYDDGKRKYKLGVAVSNSDFQAGAFDMASGEKLCQLIAECSAQAIPLVGFISSGGMQTKEGAGALFSMAVINEKLSRFIEDLDMPVIFVGFGDCTGGAQASFVTHPRAFNFYFSATNMPFAGQIVVPSYLPYRATLSNYLSSVPHAMGGLVKHPFVHDIDERLRKIDSSIPIPTETVESVFSRILKGDYSTSDTMIGEDQALIDERSRFKPIKKVLIHARGCTAAKLIRVAQAIGKQVVLVQSDPDMNSAVAEQLKPENGDSLVALGGNTSDESYLNGLSVIRVAEREGADALHPGIGFLSENPNFAKLCRLHNINFIGPLVESMETMGNKSNAVATAMHHHVPVVPGSHGIIPNAESGAAVAKDIGYPVLIKAVHGGGGKGIKIVEHQKDFIETFRQVSLEAKSAFGNGDLYLEKYVSSIRHIEAQILRDTHGNCKIVGIRDCSVQRDKQKVIEESASTMLTPALKKTVVDSATKLAHAVDYIGAGTVEFIFDLTNMAVYFMEMNTRLQVEHPVTEKVSQVDIVAEQFRIASGESIKQLAIADEGYSIEVRVVAERMVKDSGASFSFRADPGLIMLCDFPSHASIDVISAVATDKAISPYYDSLIAQIIIHEKDRPAAINGMIAYLRSVKIKGVSTNIPLLIKILEDQQFQGGEFDTNYLVGFLAKIDAALLSEEMSRFGAGAVKLDRSAIEIPESGELKVLAPGTGIFYNSPSPLDPPYLSVDDIIDVNQTLCLLEAMKVFSNLKLSDFLIGDKPVYNPTLSYQVTRINQQNGSQVNAGDLLFVIKAVS